MKVTTAKLLLLEAYYHFEAYLRFGCNGSTLISYTKCVFGK